MNARGQAMIELAIFGTFLLLGLAVIVRFGTVAGHQQRLSQLTFRKSLKRAADTWCYQGLAELRGAPKKNPDGTFYDCTKDGRSPLNQSTVFLVRDLAVPDPTNIFTSGAREEFGWLSSVTWGNDGGEFEMSRDAKDQVPTIRLTVNNVPVVDPTAAWSAYTYFKFMKDSEVTAQETWFEATFGPTVAIAPGYCQDAVEQDIDGDGVPDPAKTPAVCEKRKGTWVWKDPVTGETSGSCEHWDPTVCPVDPDTGETIPCPDIEPVTPKECTDRSGTWSWHKVTFEFLDSCQGEIMLDAGQCRARCEKLLGPWDRGAETPIQPEGDIEIGKNLPYCQRWETNRGILDSDAIIQQERTTRDTIKKDDFLRVEDSRVEDSRFVDTITDVVESDVVRRVLHKPWNPGDDRSRPNPGMPLDQALIRERTRQWHTDW